MDWRKCKIGQIVYIKHFDEFEKKHSGHPYIIFQHQNEPGKHNNIICFRITSKLHDKKYKILIKPNKLNNLDKTSAICYDAEHLFNVEDAVYFGSCEYPIFEKLLEKRLDYVFEQMKDAKKASLDLKRDNDVRKERIKNDRRKKLTK